MGHTPALKPNRGHSNVSLVGGTKRAGDFWQSRCIGGSMSPNSKAGWLAVGIVIAIGVFAIAAFHRDGDHSQNQPNAALQAPSEQVTPAPPDNVPSAWFVVDITGTECFTPNSADKASPADWIKAERDNGEMPEIKENRGTDGSLESVEISVPVGDGLQSRVWTYYRTKKLCDVALRKRNEIPDEYR